MQDSKKSEITLRLGTRGSPLALAQAHEVKARLVKAHAPLSDDNIEIIVMSTRGDRILDRPLADIGGKGLFTEEIEAALRGGEIDLAVHSLKDMATRLPDDLMLGCILEREDPRDAFISAKARRLEDLPARAVIGTASLRRQAQTLVQAMTTGHDVTVVSFRGNVQSRLKKLDNNVVDATYLAMAGLNRLGLNDDRIHPIAVCDFLPAVAQGAICIEITAHNKKMQQWLQPLNHRATELCIRAERAMLGILDGSCRTPIAGHATLDGDILTLRGQIALPDGRENHYFEAQAADSRGPHPEKLGVLVGETLRERAGEDFFKKLKAAL